MTQAYQQGKSALEDGFKKHQNPYIKNTLQWNDWRSGYETSLAKTKVKHGTFVEFPKCENCQSDIPHSWLDGDYTLLLCSEKCINENFKPRQPLIGHHAHLIHW